MQRKTLVYALSLIIVAGAVGAIGASAHGWGFGPKGESLFTQAEVEAKVAEKAAAGVITQAEADTWLERMAERETRREEMETQRDEHHAELAELLGITADELNAEIEAGKRIDEIAEAYGVSLEELQEFHKTHMLEEAKERLAQAVADGKLTQEQADERIANLESGEFQFMGPKGPKMGESEGEGFHRGRHDGMMGVGFGFQGN